MPRVGILFELQKARTVPGENICILGSQAGLGAWDPAAIVGNNALLLRTSAFVFPHWSMLAPVWFDLPEGTSSFSVQYKYVCSRFLTVSSHQKDLRWEDSIPNRDVELSVQDGAIWLLSDARWDSSAQPAVITEITQAEVRARWNRFYPDWLTAEQLRSLSSFSTAQTQCTMLDDPAPSARKASSMSEATTMSSISSREFSPRDSEEEVTEDVAAIQAEIAQGELRLALLHDRLRSLMEGHQPMACSGKKSDPSQGVTAGSGDTDIVAELETILSLREEHISKQDVLALTPDGSRTCRRSWLDSTEDGTFSRLWSWTKGARQKLQEDQVLVVDPRAIAG